MQNVKLFQKNVGEFFIGTIVSEDETTYTCVDYFMLVANVEKAPDGGGYKVSLAMLPDDIIHQSPPIFLRTFCPELMATPLTLRKDNYIRTLTVGARLHKDYLTWVERSRQATETKTVSVPTADAAKTITIE